MKEQIGNEEQFDLFLKEKKEVNVKGIIRKKLKILVIDGIVAGDNGEGWSVAKALIGNGTGKEVEFNGAWGIKVDPENKHLKEEGQWDGMPLCYAENADSASAVVCFGSDSPNIIKNITNCSLDADVVVLVNSDSLQKDILESKNFRDMIQYRKVISYGNDNKGLDADYFGKEDYKSKYVHLGSGEGCGDLLEFIQNHVVPGKNEFVFQKEVEIEKIKKIKKNDGEGILHKVKKYAKKNKKKTAAGGITGFVTLEEFLGQLGFRKSILGAVFGYNSNSKEKNVKDVKDNKDAKNEKNKEVNNSGNQVK